MGCDYMNQYMCKAKRKDSGKWVYGYYVMKEDTIFKTKLHYILRQPEGDSLASWYPVDPDTLCRCTGIKDKSGTMISRTTLLKHGARVFVREVSYRDELMVFGLCIQRIKKILCGAYALTNILYHPLKLLAINLTIQN